MDQVSLVETVRQRVRLRLQGLLLPHSTCRFSEADLTRMNLDILQGRAGWEVIDKSYQLLVVDPRSDPIWHPQYAVPYAPCVHLVLASMCDAWRRLVLPYENITYSVLSLADMDAEQGLELFWREFHKVSGCDLCEDHFFAKVLELADHAILCS